MASTKPRLHIAAAPEQVLHALAAYLVAQAHQAIAERGRFVLVLSGGSSPRRLYELLAAPPYREQVDWTRVYFFFGDERYVPPTDEASNYRMARLALLEPLGIAPAQVLAVNTSLPLAEAARAYTEDINQFFGQAPPAFDLVLLGLGDNAHTASLFPRTAVLQDDSVGAREVWVPELAAHRITLTAGLINQARAVAFLVYGADKAASVQRVLQGERNAAEYPAQLIAPVSGEPYWFLDAAAASALQAER